MTGEDYIHALANLKTEIEAKGLVPVAIKMSEPALRRIAAAYPNWGLTTNARMFGLPIKIDDGLLTNEVEITHRAPAPETSWL